MKMLVGLGNIGSKYSKTRHNTGFMVIDKLIEQQSWPKLQPDSKLQAGFCLVPMAENAKLAVLKPSTMMNLSGQSVATTASYYKIATADIWVVYDDIDLPFGAVRIRHGGSSGGHNGVNSIINAIGPDFGRIRFGVSNQHRPDRDAAQFVLSDFDSKERQILPQLIEKTADITYSVSVLDPVVAQTYNLLLKE